MRRLLSANVVNTSRLISTCPSTFGRSLSIPSLLCKRLQAKAITGYLDSYCTRHFLLRAHSSQATALGPQELETYQKGQDRRNTRSSNIDGIRPARGRLTESTYTLVRDPLDEWNVYFHQRQLSLPPSCRDSAEQLQLDTQDVHQIAAAWERCNTEAKSRVWRNGILWLLHHRPTEVPVAIQSTFSAAYPELLSYVFDCLMDLKLRLKQSSSARFARAYVALLVHVWNQIALQSKMSRRKATLEELFRSAALDSFDACRCLYEHIFEGGLRISLPSLLLIARTLAKGGQVPAALHCLRRLTDPNNPITLKEESITALCNDILISSAKDQSGFHAQAKIVEEMVSCGVRMNHIICTNLITIAIRNGSDFETAEKLFHLMEHQHGRTGQAMWRVLLNGARTHGLLGILEQYLIKALSTKSDPHTATELIRSFWFYYDVNKSREIYQALCRLYLRFFASEPLRLLGILDLSPADVVDEASFNYTPTMRTIHVMLSAYLRYHGDPEHIAETYARYRKLLLESPVEIAKLLVGPYHPTEFLKAASRHSGMLPFCMDVMHDMAEPLPKHLQGLPTHMYLKPRTTFNRKKAQLSTTSQPTLVTWSILMHTFGRAGQSRAAQKLKELMVHRGVVLDKVAWVTLIDACCIAQDIDAVVHEYKQMRMAGFELDPEESSCLRKVKDQRRLMVALERLTESMIGPQTTPASTMPGNQANAVNAESVASISAAVSDHQLAQMLPDTMCSEEPLHAYHTSVSPSCAEGDSTAPLESTVREQSYASSEPLTTEDAGHRGTGNDNQGMSEEEVLEMLLRAST